jgi:deazaflavin-dependent oxidoreductase (nitroreductase family)
MVFEPDVQVLAHYDGAEGITAAGANAFIASGIRQSKDVVMTSEIDVDHPVIVSRAPDVRLMRLFNPVIRALLRSPLHVLLSSQILLLTYTGRRSGRQYTLPVGYLPDRDAMIIVSQHSDLKRWWRNLRGGAPVAVLVRGKRLPARADEFTGLGAGVWEPAQPLGRSSAAWPPTRPAHSGQHWRLPRC